MKNKHIIISGIALFLITILLFGLTYAYYKTRIVDNSKDKSVSVVSKNLKITYSDGNGVIEGTEIEPGYSATKTFTVENTGDEALKYSIKLDNITNTFSRTKDWTYVLKKEDVEVSSGVLPVTETYIVNSTSIDSKKTDTYSLTVTYANLTDVDQSADMGKFISIRVNIDEAVETVFENASKETLLKAIGSDNLISKTLTTPAVTSSSENEAVLASTEDDYGDSYYFRGAVNNNFVNFSGMCWRVVRIQGDGSIKITLADRDHECNSSDYSTSLVDSAFVSTDTFNYKLAASKTSDDLKYETSDLKTVLEAWLNGGDYAVGGKTGTFEKKIDDTKLVEAEWCNDMSISSKTYYDENHKETVDASKALYTDYNYGFSDRIMSQKFLMLKCNMIGLDETKAVTIKSKIGLLTSDEIAYAGGSYEGGNWTYYLKDNANQLYWTMSPSHWNTYGSARVWDVDGAGKMRYSGVNYLRLVRPALVLRSDVEITSGNGTQTNPYVVR